MLRSARLGAVCEITGGGTPSRAYPDYYVGSIPWVTGADFTSPVITAARFHISDEAVASSATTVVPKGTVLLLTRTSVGKVALAGMKLAFNQDILALEPDPTVLTPSYLAHFLRTKEATLARQARGATIKGVPHGFVAELEIPLPTIAEQQRLATSLNAAERIKELRRAAAAEGDALVPAVFLEMFTGPDEARWPSRTVGEVAVQMRTGPFGSQLLHSEFSPSGFAAVLGIDNAVSNEFRWGAPRFISKAKYDTLRRYTVAPGDVLITIMGTCGRCAVVPDDVPIAVNTKHLCCITPDQQRCRSEFLRAYFLYHPIARNYLQHEAKGAIMSGLNMATIRELPMRLPPIELQRQFERRVGAIAAIVRAQRRAVAEAEALFGALQARVFVGAREELVSLEIRPPSQVLA